MDIYHTVQEFLNKIMLVWSPINIGFLWLMFELQNLKRFIC